MGLSFEQAIIEVWRQTLVENAEAVQLGAERYPVRRTPKKGLRQVDFVFDGNEIRRLEQNQRRNLDGRRWLRAVHGGAGIPAATRRSVQCR